MVTRHDTLDVNELMERAIADPLALCQRILQQVLEQLAREYGVEDGGGEAPEETLAVALGNRLAQTLLDGNVSAAREPSAVGGESGASATYDELLDRDAALAAALGACDCWGECADCPLCRGIGTPGWEVPDRELFATYVHPALRALTKRDAAPVGAQPKRAEERKERGDV